jgi:radical SAM protein with 4Fe4S-binding SPASM domain
MSCSLAGDQHCNLSCGSQEASKSAQVDASSSATLTLHPTAPSPAIVVWETTQACDLKCVHCRVNSRPHRHPLELSTAEAFHLVDQIAKMKVPEFVLTGGDPLKRADLLPIVQYATQHGVPTALTPSITPLLVRQAIFDLKQSGLVRIAVSLDGSTPQLHDAFRAVSGAYKRSIEAIGWCHEARLPVQVNTTVSRRNLADLDNIIELLIKQRVSIWNLFFLVPNGRAQLNDLLTGDEHEQVFAKLYEASRQAKFQVKTTEGQHYRRFVLQQEKGGDTGKAQRGASQNLSEGNGFVYVSHTGEVYPSGFMPLSAGNILWEPLSEIYSNSQLFRSLHDSSQLRGKCGHCEFRDVCGGSRARAYAMSHDILAEEPRCAYVPA